MKTNYMKYGRVELAIMLIVAIISLSACANRNQGIVEIDVHVGTDALTADFIKSNPPDMIYFDKDNTEFGVSLDVQNKGATNINEGYLNILLEKDYVDFAQDTTNPIKFSLTGKSQGDPNGAKVQQSYYLKAKLPIDSNSYSKKTQISALFCYDYMTSAVTQVCIDPDVLNQRVGQKVCTPSDKSLSSQGAPVAITRIETRMIPQGDMVIPSFLIYVQNRGNGQVLNPDRIALACSADKKTDDTWNIILAEVSLGTTKLDCKPLPLHLKNKEDYIKCDLVGGIEKSRTAYMSALQIDLRYGYTFTKSKTVEIKRAY